MTPDRWKRIEDLFRLARERPENERDEFLRTSCGDDGPLRLEIESLLAQLTVTDSLQPTGTMPMAAVATRTAGLIGARIGVFRIDAILGAGGMGEVYRAHDTALGRDVALKVLPPRFASDADRLGRFKREARTLAALNHPNIAAIYGLEDSPSCRALILELVDGETLAQRLSKGPLAIPEARRVTAQIARALEAAHDKGIVHRDLKPANISITPAGIVKVLDFGLAKLTDGSAARAASITDSLGDTRDGMVVGTAAYMSPEQARGQSVDRRTDLWSFGCVLFEMLTGVSPFAATTVSDTIALVLVREPNWLRLPSDTPRSLRRVLERCLVKDPSRRLRDIADVALDLEADRELPEPEPEALPQAAAGTRRLRTAAIVGAALVIVAVVVWGVTRMLTRAPEAAHEPTVKFTFTPERLRRGNISDIDAEVSISPDGRHVAYVESTGGQLWVRDIDQEQARIVPGATSVYEAFWSPDNRFIAYANQLNLSRIPAEGGTPAVITKLAARFRGGTWSGDGKTIVYCDLTGMYTVPAAGGAPTRILEHPHIEQPSFLTLPNGRQAYLFQVSEQPFVHEVQYMMVGEQQRHTIVASSSSNPYPVYSDTGHILYVDGVGSSIAIWALPFSLRDLTATGKPFPIAQHGSSPKLAQAGTLVYSDVPSNQLDLVWTDRSGKTLSKVGPEQLYDSPTLSPDGRTIAVNVRNEKGWDIWIQESGQTNLTRFTFEGGAIATPAWSASGDEIFYGRMIGNNADILARPLRGDGPVRSVIATPAIEGLPAPSPDGRYLVYEVLDPQAKRDVWYRPLTRNGVGEATALTHTPFNESNPTVSPDGRFIAYASDETGRDEIYVRSFPNGDGKWRVSNNGGQTPRWRHDGRELFYVEGQQLTAVGVTTRPTFSAGKTTSLFSNPMLASASRAYDVTPDGQRFIVRERPPDERPLAIHVVHHWFEEFRTKAASPTP
jgi:Tol biopolymer transport system component/aminoglycoside phosphotransferase (APT) family kinase protein